MATTAPAPTAPFGPSNSPKKLKHKGSKPIINWITKKFASSHAPRPGRSASHVLPGGSDALRPGPVRGRAISLQTSPTSEPIARTVVLNDDQDLPSPSAAFSERNSMTADSMWTKMSPPPEADDDASIRPLPPTSPPSPTPTASSTSQFSDPRTFRSGAASTKPTTLMSIDSGNGGGLIAGTMAHIAQFTGGSSSSPTGGASRFSAPLVHPAVARAASTRYRSTTQAPLHSYPHPRNNPNPTSPPADNASTLTLASSAFALSARANDWTDGASLSLDQYQQDADVNSSHMGLEDDDVEVAASVRALRPRSSRRGSWESEESRWSARVGSGLPNINGAPSIVSGMTRPSSVGGQSIAQSLSIGKLKAGLGVTDSEGRRFGSTGDAIDSEKDQDESSIKIQETAPSPVLNATPMNNDATITPATRSSLSAIVRTSTASGDENVLPAPTSPLATEPITG